MKKIFIIFLSIIILSLTFALPIFATLGESYQGMPNLLSDSSTVNAFVNGSGGLQPFYYVNLEAGKNYTFYAPKGVNKLLVSPIVDNPVFNYPVVYERPSYNLYNGGQIDSESGFIYKTFNPPNFSSGQYKFIFTYSSSSSFDFFLQIGTTTANRVNLLQVTVPAGSGQLEYSFNVSVELYDQFLNNMLLLVRALNSDVTMNMIIVADEDAATNVYEPIFTNPFYYPYQLTMVNFYCEQSGEYAVGFNANGFEGYSRITSSDNPVVLVEGAYSFDSIVDAAYNNGYNSGYDQGYKEGEYDGMNSTSILKSTILTVMSGPFVIVSNALNFEIFGINIFTFIQIILTILIVAFLITRLKGRE